MHVCIVMEYHPNDLIGGSEIQVFGLARQFALAGHQVSYVCQRFDRARPADEMVDGVRVLRVLRWHRLFRWVGGPRMLRTLRGLRSDVVYQRFASPYTGLAAGCARILHVPFVWGCAEDITLEKDFRFQSPGSKAAGLAPRVKQAVLRADGAICTALFRWGVGRANEVIVQNREQQELLASNHGRPGLLIPNGIVVPPAGGDRSERPLVLWLNRLYRRKNAEAFIRLAKSLADQHPDAQFALVGGRQPDAYWGEVTSLATGAGNLQMLGNVPPAQVQSWFERAWVFVLTSTGEGFPNVLLQAWASATPVVSLTVDPDGLIADQGLGLLSRTEEQLQIDVGRLLKDAELRLRLGQASRAYVEQHFDFGVIARRYLSLFEDCRSTRR